MEDTTLRRSTSDKRVGAEEKGREQKEKRLWGKSKDEDAAYSLGKTVGGNKKTYEV